MIEDHQNSQWIQLPTVVSFPRGAKRANVCLRRPDEARSPTQKTWNAFFLHAPKGSDFCMDQS